ncbi:MAG TPA: NUDIX hydrolase [Allosphingosinicella sp.]|nr:NUDIX hydrolase [Allosphingosinicella sp.]
MKRPPLLGKLHRSLRSRGRRLQVGALPYRQKEDGSLEVLLVTTRGTGRWMVPKGWPMAGKSFAEAAEQEAFEEGGVRGSISAEEIGSFDHDKTRLLSRPLRCKVAVYLMKVEHEMTRWPEQGERRRRWFGLEEAARAVSSERLSQIIRSIEGPRL